jgi:malate dehydrogenase (oxaloacetate-decarboxylating)
VVEKAMGDLTVVVAGAGAAGVAVTRILLAAGVGDVIVTDSRGVLGPDRAHEADLPVHKADLVRDTNVHGVTGAIGDALEGADVLIGVSGGTVVERDLMRMAPRAIIFALANPDPEVHPTVARRFAEVVATGRSDFPNQINNVLAFPGIFRGALDSGARAITEEMKLAAAHAIAGLVEHPTAERIVPSVFDERVAPAVADAVARLASRR